MPEESVKVAVRVRPFNKRERARNAVCIVNMNGMETKLTGKLLLSHWDIGSPSMA